MNKVIITLGLFFVLFMFSKCNTPKNIADANHVQKEYVKNSLIIYYDVEVGKQELLKKVKSYKAKVDYDYNNLNAIAITFQKNKSIEDAEQYFKNVKGVLQVSKNNINTIQPFN